MLSDLKNKTRFKDIAIYKIPIHHISDPIQVDRIFDHFKTSGTFNMLIWWDVLATKMNDVGEIVDDELSNINILPLLQLCSKLNIGITYVTNDYIFDEFIDYLSTHNLRADQILKDTDNDIIHDFSKYQIVFMTNSGLSAAYDIVLSALRLIANYDRESDCSN